MPFLRFFVCIIAATLLSNIVRADAPKRPNLVVIMTDDQAQWACSAYGNKECLTPNMDRIGHEGAIFSNAFVVTPVCSPSRLEFFTGRYGTEGGITDWINFVEADNGMGIPADFTTWPQVLQKAGYTTALVGKWHLGTKDQFHPIKHGFDHFYGFRSGGAKPMDPELETEMSKPQVVKGPIADLLADDAMEWVTKNKDRPFALCLFFREPHQPYGPMPNEDVEALKDLDPTVPNNPHLDPEHVKSLTKHYYEAIHAADRNIGRFLAKLDDLKLTDNTIVIFTSDHGYNVGQHMLHTKGNAAWMAGGIEGPKRPNMFDTSLRVPLMIRWPGTVKPGTTIDQVVLNIDSFPTILGMLDISMPADVKQHGRDFSPIIRGQSIEWNNDYFGQYDLHNGGLAFMRMIRTPKWKLVRFHMCNGLNELYDLEHDPGETKNLYHARSARAMRDELQARLTKWQESINDPVLKLDAGRPIENFFIGGE
jgi:uncharacterized sulfatase